jgi:hypothetical protein
LDNLVLSPLDFKENSSGLRSSNARGQLPDSQCPKAFGRFIFEEISILKEPYCPNDADFEEGVFEKFRSIPPLHLVVPFKSFLNSLLQQILFMVPSIRSDKFQKD